MEKHLMEFHFSKAKPKFCLSLLCNHDNSHLSVDGKEILTLFRMGLFGAAHRWMGGGANRPPLPKICHTYPTMMKFDIVIPYLKNI